MKKRKGPLYNLATQDARNMRASGVPGRFWQIRNKDIGQPSNIVVERPWYKDGKPYQATPGQQQKWIDDIILGDALLNTTPVVAVGSEPTDDMGLVFGAAVVRRALDLLLKPLMVPAHKGPRDLALEFAPDVFILYNLSMEASTFRCESCCDWLTEMDEMPRIVIVAGCNAAGFFLDKLHRPFSQALYFKGQYEDGEASICRV